ncbi:MAG: LysM peptidoglycan-binding domain-containing protein, partial [Christensenellales bacterium]
SRDISILTSTNGDDVHMSTSELNLSTYIGKAYEKFDVTGDLQIDNAMSVLMVTPCVSLYDVQPKDNYLIVNGKLNVDICYKTGDNVQDINTKYHSIDFSWEVALDGLNSDSVVQSVVSLISNEIKVSTVIEEGTATINLYVPVVYTGYVFNTTTLEVVDDLYLEKNYMSVTCENFNTITGKGSVRFKDNISGTASILDTAPFIDEILGVSTNNLVLASSRVEGDRLCIEGVANSTVIYYTKDTGDITSVQVEMPFAVEEKVEGDKSGVVTICLENIGARSKRGKEIEVSAELNVYTDMFSENTLCAITGVNVGEEKPLDDCALYLYIVKPNQTIWDVAKDVNTSQELILEQNPDVELPLKAGDKLVVYKPNIMKF